MLWIPIDRTLDIPLKRQVYEYIRKLILHGELRAGEKLPATRECASHLGISRNVVIEAFEQLLAEGYIVGHQGSGTFVAEGAFLEQMQEEQTTTLEISEECIQEKDVIDFRSGIPALDMFPKKDWGRLAKEVCLEAPDYTFGYDHPEGRLELRKILSQYLRKTRGVKCHADQIVITTGATQAFSLITKLLLSQGDKVFIEDPITNEIQTIFTSTGASLIPIPVDEQGMRTDLLSDSEKPRFIFVTPSHQFPLGSILPIQRRIQLIQYARANECYIVEDDYDSEFRYNGEPISSLQGLDSERVIYVGTFSKNLSPALRMGYLVLPQALIERCKSLKWFHDLHTPSLNQMILARFIEEGLLERHIRKMRKVYMKRRKALREVFLQEFGKTAKILGDSTGLHLIAEFKGVEFTEDIIKRLFQNHVKVYPVEHHAIRKGRHVNKVILGYGNLRTEEIKEGVCKLRTVLEN
ncbi:PLP-dependent aminotransferase family protein [Neobacillus sp. OS1-32]|uniref:MocR-like pyridoxine biosynthesis transcription factor PdxR n=1 Tax=Neobacillus sp. OS1-32 TaxID=3070682 RepID=UPI0027DF349B|nr:PLP-dependent aminotransferase family protein [Neobacillus sp. OS1-32]WML28672.1 PLP-dependent aminotransferase family protein [Neobacillus sp. OS1-32]